MAGILFLLSTRTIYSREKIIAERIHISNEEWKKFKETKINQKGVNVVFKNTKYRQQML